MSLGGEIDANVERLKNSRDNVAVLKLELIKLRARCPRITVFVVEGVEDKSVYSQWMRRVRNDLRHEYYVSGGKKQVLQLRRAVERDLGGLSESVYYFIDRDFDDYAGTEASTTLFMTDRYSTENYIVTEEVLEDILRVEMSCNGHPAVRDAVCQLFATVYETFLLVTREINFRLFVAKKANIKRVGAFPDRISQLCVVSLQGIESQVRTPAEVIALEREPTDEEITVSRAEFATLTPQDRYRGKFAMLFFNRWLDLLVDDYASTVTKYFADIDERARARRHEIVFSSLAARAPLPVGFEDFVQAI